MEWRVTVKQFADGAQCVIHHLILITHQLTLDERQTGALIEFQAGLHVETTQPRPSCSLMVGIVTLCLRTYIHRVVTTALWRQRTQSLRGQQLTRTDIEHVLLLVLRQRRVVECYWEYHVGANAPVHHVAIHIVEQIAVLVHEGVHKRCLTNL